VRWMDGGLRDMVSGEAGEERGEGKIVEDSLGLDQCWLSRDILILGAWRIGSVQGFGSEGILCTRS